MNEEVFLDELVGFAEGIKPEDKVPILMDVINRLVADNLRDSTRGEDFYVFMPGAGFRFRKTSRDATPCMSVDYFTGNAPMLVSNVLEFWDRAREPISIMFYNEDIKTRAYAAFRSHNINIYYLRGLIDVDKGEIRLHQLKKSPPQNK